MGDVKKYYVLCDDNCKFEGMTKEQIFAAIEQAVTSGEIKDVDTGFVTKIKEQNAGVGLSFWVGTQAEYNALETKAANCFYITTDDTTIEDIKEAATENKKALDELSGKVARFGRVFLANDSWDVTTCDLEYEGIGDYTIFIIDGVLCARLGGEIKGCNSSYQGLGTIGTEFTTIQIAINNDILSVEDAYGFPPKVKTHIADDGTITNSTYTKIYSIIGVC